MTDSSSGVKYSDMPISTGSNGSYTLGNLCVDPSESGTLEIVFGSNLNESFVGCNRKFSFHLDCASIIDSASNCCDNIDLSVNHYIESFPDLCCTDIILNPTDSIHCIYGIDFNIAGNDQINYVRKDTIPLVLGVNLDTLFTYCAPYASCLPPLTAENYVKRKITFRGKNDEIICEDTVSILICCDIINDPGDPGSGLNKTNNNFIKNNDTQFSVIPNPTDGNLQLLIKNLANEIIDINIINQDSQVLKTFSHIQINNQTEEINLNINELTAGAYIVHISNSNINLSTKIIKLK